MHGKSHSQKIQGSRYGRGVSCFTDLSYVISTTCSSRPLLGKHGCQLQQIHIDILCSVDYATDELISKTIRQWVWYQQYDRRC